MDNLVGSQSLIITLDLDAFLIERLQQIQQSEYCVVEVNCSDQHTLHKIINEFPNLRIGAGNVIDLQQLEQCYQAGAHFITSPGFLPELAQTANLYSINYLPGVATISEAMHAASVGCQNVRPYPASLNFCSLLSKCMPLLRLYPAEIDWEDAAQFLKLPSVAAVSVLNPEGKQLHALEVV